MARRAQYQTRIENRRTISDAEAEEMKVEATKRQGANAKKLEIDEATEELLDEIEEVLETNAEIFVAHFIQSGGE